VSSQDLKLLRNIKRLQIRFYRTHKSTRDVTQDFDDQGRTPANFYRTSESPKRMSALAPKADMIGDSVNVR
jgi:hypothetical protein